MVYPLGVPLAQRPETDPYRTRPTMMDTPAARLTAFVAALAAVFALGFALGHAVDPFGSDPAPSVDTAPGTPGHGHGG